MLADEVKKLVVVQFSMQARRGVLEEYTMSTKSRTWRDDSSMGMGAVLIG
jgi:hypothetical protein